VTNGSVDRYLTLVVARADCPLHPSSCSSLSTPVMALAGRRQSWSTTAPAKGEWVVPTQTNHTNLETHRCEADIAERRLLGLCSAIMAVIEAGQRGIFRSRTPRTVDLPQSELAVPHCLELADRLLQTLTISALTPSCSMPSVGDASEGRCGRRQFKTFPTLRQIPAASGFR
jgi:hypothetical protein